MVAGYLLPIHGLQRLEKIMDEYVGGISTMYVTNGVLLERGLELLQMLREDVEATWAPKTCTSCSECGSCTTGCSLPSP